MLGKITWGTVIGHTILLIGLLLVTRLVLAREWLFIIDDANLLFHEAGHVIFSTLGEHMTVLGGTIMQLFVPLAVAGAFARQYKWFATYVSLWWVGQNLISISIYMADARAQVLPLLGDGTHDWHYLFTSMGVLERDLQISSITYWIGFGFIAFGLIYAAKTIAHDAEGILNRKGVQPSLKFTGKIKK